MDSPTKSPGEAERDIIVAGIASFLPPSVARVLGTTSSGYETSVSRAQADKLTNKRRVEALVGESLLDEPGHDWRLTYELAYLKSIALFYTGSGIDAYVGEKLGLVSPELQPTTSRQTIFREMISDENRREHTAVMKVLLKYLLSRGPISKDEYKSVVERAVTNNRIAILEIPEVFAAMNKMNGPSIAEILEAMTGYHVSPRTADFFLANVHIIGSGMDPSPYVAALIKDGSTGIIRVFLKHDLFNPFEEIDGDDEYIEKNADYFYRWSPLWLVAKYGRLDMVKFFLEDPRLKDLENFSFGFGEVVRRNHAEIFGLLLETGKLDGDVFDYRLQIAVDAGYTEIVRMILFYPKRREIQSYELYIKSAVNNDRTEIALLLLGNPNLHLDQEQKDDLISTARYNGNQVLERAIRLQG